MKSVKIVTIIRTTLYLLALAVMIVSCNNGQGMMHGGGTSMYMGSWNWVLILLGIIIGFLLGYLVARRRK
jgi:hypothetical protein